VATWRTNGRTERGVQRVAPIVSIKLGADRLPKEIDSISTIHRKLIDILFSDGQYSPIAASPRATTSPLTRQFTNDSQADRQRLLSYLQENLRACRNDTFSNVKVASDHKGFVYSSQESLAASQRVLVDLKTHLTESLELCTFEELSDYYSSLVLLLKRQELDFKSIS